MGETFVISINCEKILPCDKKSNYTMLIDSKKMSIVYELSEWIRWVFAVENCFYITHENSVIHELEDIKVLSRLKNVEVNPCEQSFCIHKKPYKNLLNNLNLFTKWNGVEVHNYFLYKINQIEENLNYEKSEATSVKFNLSSKGRGSLNQCNSVETTNSNSCTSEPKKSSLLENNLAELEGCLMKSSESESSQKSLNETKSKKENVEVVSSFTSSNCTAPGEQILKRKWVNDSAAGNYLSAESKRQLKTGQDSFKSRTSKYIRPFSIGEVLSNIRQLENLNVDTKPLKNKSTSEFDEEKSDEKITDPNDEVKVKTPGKQKRHRVRKRKKLLRENQSVSPMLGNNWTEFKDNTLHTDVFKPNHIRFNIDDGDDLIQTECFKNELQTQNGNESEIISDKMNGFDCSPCVESDCEKLAAATADSCPNLLHSAEIGPANTDNENKDGCLFTVDEEMGAEGKLTDLHEVCDNGKLTFVDDKFISNSSNPNLITLLSLKNKFKSAVVIERFY